MPVRSNLLIATACIAICGLANTALAQTPPPDNGKVSFQSGILPKKPKPGPPDVPAPPQAWPRLEPGAVLCKTEDDLDRLAARHTGEGGGGPVDCQVIHIATAIAIVQRLSPAKTEVRLTSGKAGTVGWTDAWLPERPPPSATRASVR